MLRLGSWFLLVLAGLAVFFVLGTYASSTDVAARLVLHVGVACLALGFFGVAIRTGRWLVLDEVTAGAAVVALLGFVSAAGSARPRLAFEGAIGIAAAAIVFTMLWSLMHDRWFARRLTTLLAVLPFVMLGAYALHIGAAWIEWWSTVGRITTPPLRPNLGGLWFGSPNVVASVLLLTVPQGAARLPFWRHRGRAATAVVGAALAAGVVLTGSRGGVVALIVVGLLAAAWKLRAPALHLRVPRRQIGLALIGAGVLVAVALPVVIPRFISTAGADQRLAFWEASLSMLQSSPITGVGPGVWPIAKLVHNPGGAPNLVVPHAHNTLIHVAAELGALGVLGFLLLTLIVTRLIVRRVRDPDTRHVAIGSAMGLVGFGVTTLVDHALNLGSVFLLLALVVVGLAPAATEERPAGGRAVRPTAIVGAGLVLVAGITAVRWDVATFQAEQAERLIDAGRLVDARDRLMDASKADPDLPMLSLDLGLIDARLGRPEAVSLIERAAAEDGLAMHLVSLSRLRADAGDLGGALASARQALERDPGDENVALNVGAIAEELQDLALARRAYAQAIMLDPELAWSPYWEHPGRIVTRDAVVAGALDLVPAGDPLARATIETFARRPVTVAVADRDAPFLDALRVLVESGPRAALPVFQALVEQDPLDPRPVVWCERLSRALGDTAAAARYARWAVALGADPSARAAKRGSVVGPVQDDGARPIPGNYPWALYGRSGARNLVVPGVLVIDPQAIPVPDLTAALDHRRR